MPGPAGGSNSGTAGLKISGFQVGGFQISGVEEKGATTKFHGHLIQGLQGDHLAQLGWIDEVGGAQHGHRIG